MSGGFFELHAASGCQYANDGYCDVPQYCAANTDVADCSGELYRAAFVRAALGQLTQSGSTCSRPSSNGVPVWVQFARRGRLPAARVDQPLLRAGGGAAHARTDTEHDPAHAGDRGGAARVRGRRQVLASEQNGFD